jgi:hypothetical protein
MVHLCQTSPLIRHYRGSDFTAMVNITPLQRIWAFDADISNAQKNRPMFLVKGSRPARESCILLSFEFEFTGG